MLYEFVQQGGTLITEGNTSAVFRSTASRGAAHDDGAGPRESRDHPRGCDHRSDEPDRYGSASTNCRSTSVGTLLDAGVRSRRRQHDQQIDVVRPGSSGGLAGCTWRRGVVEVAAAASTRTRSPWPRGWSIGVWDQMQQWRRPRRRAPRKRLAGGWFRRRRRSGGAGARTRPTCGRAW